MLTGINWWTSKAASSWRECPSRFGKIVRLYWIFWHKGIVINSHLLWFRLWLCSIWSPWLNLSFVCCCVEITTEDGCEATRLICVTIIIIVKLNCNFILILDIFWFGKLVALFFLKFTHVFELYRKLFAMLWWSVLKLNFLTYQKCVKMIWI